MVDRLAGDAGPAPLDAHREAIDRLFAFDTVEEIFAALEADGSDWALKQLGILKTKSPQSLKVSLRQIRTGAGLASFAENMAMEYALGGRVVQTHDFQEGVRAVIADKDNVPKWSPPTCRASATRRWTLCSRLCPPTRLGRRSENIAAAQHLLFRRPDRTI